MKYNGLDVYDITLGKDNIGIKATSLVALPAMESPFLHFNEDKPQFIFTNDEKRELMGAIMIPDKLIYRNIDGNRFYVNFTSDVIRDLTSKMIQSGAAGLFTIQHQHETNEDAINIQEVWIKESENDKSVDFGIDEPIGTAFMKVKVNDETIWKAVKENGLNGFSIELDASIVEKNELLFNKQEEKMTITDVFKNAIDVDGVSLHFNAELVKGAYLVQEGEDGVPVAYNGEFTKDNVSYKVENGVVLETVDIELNTQEAIEQLATEFSALKESLVSLSLSKTELEGKEAELELLRTQFEADKEAFEALKAKGIPKAVNVNLSKQISDRGSVGAEWLKKFN